ncbi:bL17 family ribosomal protein [Rhodopirellula europaea]|jgi:large subunit ribosomal protein L17|uniref:Large ribosomal subunit protein bL17 n=1 Tax=Rhodopirellula europaea SH398 TaxID=1263868 RepID=M5S6L3_9BACT|nr:L17 family ribosomal protein [Rhodopirellula europaea]EMI27111.1 50S ribosomal protein L17 [Rhodopirellula europaea SH398]|tara:strand:- start:749 stop:1381 length:633 start_codon:yes stop_codon:yes gene_type:complete
MRHRRKGRVLGRSPAHRKALMRNLSSALFLTERDASLDENAPKVPGRIITTLEKAKEVRPLVEKCITLAKRALPALEEAKKYETSAERGSDEYKKWRKSEEWTKWADARAPYVNAQRRVLQLIGDREAVAVLFDTIAERFTDRPGGYTRIMRLAKPRLGDGGTRAILELVGKNDRVTRSAQRPAFEQDAPESDSAPEVEAKTEEETASAN